MKTCAIIIENVPFEKVASIVRIVRNNENAYYRIIPEFSPFMEKAFSSSNISVGHKGSIEKAKNLSKVGKLAKQKLSISQISKRLKLSQKTVVGYLKELKLHE